MVSKILNFLVCPRMAILSGIFLAGSFVIHLCDYHTAWNPALFTLVISGVPLAIKALHELCRGRITSTLLVTIAMIACVLLRRYFDAGVIAFIVMLGELLENRLVKRAQRGVERLVKLNPTHCIRLDDGHETLAEIGEIAPGDVIRVRPGDIIPVDGTVQRGFSAVDESNLTGESIPTEKAYGSKVASGTMNGYGVLDITADKTGEESSLQKLVRMLQEAENGKTPTARIMGTLATILVPVAFVLAIAVGILTHDITKTVAILVVFCPSALVLSTPTAIAAAIGHAAKRGVVIKSGEALEKVGRADRIAFDKTGTLSYGKLSVSALVPLDDLDEDTLLQIAASAEMKSSHPLGRAIWQAASMHELPLKEPDEFKAYRGRGVRAMLNDFEVFCGSEDFFREIEIPVDADTDTKILQLRAKGMITVLVAGDGRLCGVIGLSDILRPDAAEAVKELGKLGAAACLLTGDHIRTAEKFAADLGIFEIGAHLLAADKAELIGDMQKDKHVVCMVGDGVNDAPALQQADVGVTLAPLTDGVGTESADVEVVTDQLSSLVYLKRLGNIARSVIILNVIMTLSINLAAIVLAVFGWVNPVYGALIHTIGALVVLVNAAFLYDRKIGGITVEADALEGMHNQ